MDLENQKRVKDFADEYGAENLVVVLGAAILFFIFVILLNKNINKYLYLQPHFEHMPFGGR